jgi:mono/diheme cytochrome c family protein
MMRLAAFAVIGVLAGAGLTAAAAEEKPVALKPGQSLDLVEGNCAACHSLDYIQMNSPFLNAAGWQAEVTKMIKAYGAPIEDADAKSIVDYLAKNYGM